MVFLFALWMVRYGVFVRCMVEVVRYGVFVRCVVEAVRYGVFVRCVVEVGPLWCFCSLCGRGGPKLFLFAVW